MRVRYKNHQDWVLEHIILSGNYSFSNQLPVHMAISIFLLPLCSASPSVSLLARFTSTKKTGTILRAFFHEFHHQADTFARPHHLPSLPFHPFSKGDPSRCSGSHVLLPPQEAHPAPVPWLLSLSLPPITTLDHTAPSTSFTLLSCH